MSAAAERYAAALASVALERKRDLQGDLSAFVDVFFSSAELRNALESPAVSREVKERVIREITEKIGIDETVRNFIYLVVAHRRTKLFREILAALEKQLNMRMGIAEAEVSSAKELSDAEKKELTAVLERRTGKRIKAQYREDEALLGGVVVRVGSTIYDGSVREQLNRLREQLETE